jgi:hypothetical protein
MCVNLAYYLVKCGVAKASIAILTPYKGQLMLIRKLLLSDQSKARLLTHDSSNQDQVRLSTVDRFQVSFACTIDFICLAYRYLLAQQQWSKMMVLGR